MPKKKFEFKPGVAYDKDEITDMLDAISHCFRWPESKAEAEKLALPFPSVDWGEDCDYSVFDKAVKITIDIQD